ncbi:MAG: DUF348 domain-containing protein [Anaerolineales bacterium]|jgi:uncharacterized protein YabE (DUF348 family)|nr:DUF348 domain-containing protein [Anaerolineales bacterium]
MTPKRIRWLAIVAAVLVLLAGYAATARQVTILVDGQAEPLTTRALSVGAALAEAGVVLAPADTVQPARWMPLRNGLVIAVERAARIHLFADGEWHHTVSSERQVRSLLAEWDVELAAADQLLLAGRPLDPAQPLPTGATLVLTLRRPVTITLEVDGQTQQFQSAASTLGEALAAQGIALAAADQLQPPAETPLDAALSAQLVRARPLTVQLAGESHTVYSPAATVGEALAQAGVALQGEDYSVPAEDQPVPADGQIRVVRVQESVQLVQEIVPHETRWQPDDSAELDQQSVVQLGQDGVQAARVRVRYEDGQEVSRQTEAERLLVQPVEQINGYGTKIVIHTAVVDGVTIEYYRAVQVFATSYSPCRSGVPDKCYHGTSLGLPVKRGVIATWYNWYIALGGHSVYIPGYGSAVVADVGAYRDRSVPWIDLAYTDDDYVGWAQYVTMYFTTPVPPDVPLVWPP